MGEELLPPVETPSARFIVQLFIVPALIVAGIVGVWLSINWLVRTTTIGPDKLIDGVEKGPSVARWQRASELADMLHNKRYASLKRDHESANRLAQILVREIDQSRDGNDGQESATLRYFLARRWASSRCSMGLVRCCRRRKRNARRRMRWCDAGRSKRLAVRAFSLQKLEPPQQLAHPDLEAALSRLSADEDATIRSAAAYALGQLGTAAAIKQLEVLVNDSDKDTRYNAAIALAHRGNTKSAETLAEMLDLDELTKPSAEEAKGGAEF